MFGGSFWIVNPTRRMGMRLRFGIGLPLVPGFPLFGGWLVKGPVVTVGSTRCEMMYHDGSSDVPTMQGEE